MVLSSMLRHSFRGLAWTLRVPCGRVSEFRNGSRNGVFSGGGDTQFEPVFEEQKTDSGTRQIRTVIWRIDPDSQ